MLVLAVVAITPLLMPWDKCAEALSFTALVQSLFRRCDPAEFHVPRLSLEMQSTCSAVGQNSAIILDTEILELF